MIEVIFTCYVGVLDVKVCGLIKGLLRMYGVMGLHMLIAIVE